MRRFLHSLKNISPPALTALRVVLIGCCATVFAGFVICLRAGDPSIANFGAYRLAESLARTPAGMLLIAGIGLIALEGRP